MLRGISAIDSLNIKHILNIKKQANTTNPISKSKEQDVQSLKTLPYGYITFKGNTEKNSENATIKFTEDGNALLHKAAEFAIENKK